MIEQYRVDSIQHSNTNNATRETYTPFCSKGNKSTSHDNSFKNVFENCLRQGNHTNENSLR